MQKIAHLVLVLGVVAAGLVAFARASPPTILTIKEAATASQQALASTTADDADSSASPAQQGLFANNRIRIQDSQIFLTDSDRKQLIKTIARTMAADATRAITLNATAPADSSLLSLGRDAFLYLKDDGVVRLGWRYPLATWKIYKAYMVPQTCEVNRAVGDYFYC